MCILRIPLLPTLGQRQTRQLGPLQHPHKWNIGERTSGLITAKLPPYIPVGSGEPHLLHTSRMPRFGLPHHRLVGHAGLVQRQCVVTRFNIVAQIMVVKRVALFAQPPDHRCIQTQ